MRISIEIDDKEIRNLLNREEEQPVYGQHYYYYMFSIIKNCFMIGGSLFKNSNDDKARFDNGNFYTNYAEVRNVVDELNDRIEPYIKSISK